MNNVVILGPPGSGKTLCCKFAAKTLGMSHIATGNILQSNIKRETNLGISAKERIDAQELVPDKLVVQMLCEALAEPECVSKSWLLDGFPRTVEQYLELERRGVIPDKVVVLELPEEQCEARITGRRIDKKTGDIYHIEWNPPRDDIVRQRLRRRPDDTAENVKSRLEAFNAFTGKVRRAYKTKVVTVDAAQPLHVVFADVVEAIRNGTAERGNPEDDMKDSVHKEMESLALDLDQQKQMRRSSNNERNKLRIERFEFMQELMSGINVIKHGRRGSPHTRTIFCNPECTKIYWQKPGGKDLKQRDDACIELNSVSEILTGRQTEVFKRSGENSKSDRYISLVAGDRTLDIETLTVEQFGRLHSGFNLLLSNE